MPHKEQHHVEFVPEDYPPFPADLKTIDLQTISLQKIQNADSAEQDRMFAACKNWGFFYLDLTQSDQGELISQGAAQVARVAEGVMALPLEEKEQYPFTDGNIFGYVSNFMPPTVTCFSSRLQVQEGRPDQSRQGEGLVLG